MSEEQRQRFRDRIDKREDLDENSLKNVEVLISIEYSRL